MAVSHRDLAIHGLAVTILIGYHGFQASALTAALLAAVTVFSMASADDASSEVAPERAQPRGSLLLLAILVAIGRTPNVSGLGLEAIGVDFNRGGIKVDNRLRTSRKHIYAAGDINGGYQFTHVAGYEGGIVIANAVFRLPRKADYTYLPWCTYTDPELASIGNRPSTVVTVVMMIGRSRT